MAQINIKAGGLYVLSGPPGTGKSTLLANSRLPQGFVQSSDALRLQILGSMPVVCDQGYQRVEIFDHADQVVFDCLWQIVRVRAMERLTTIVDATSVTEEDRAIYAAIAEQAGVPFEVLILDTPEEVARARNQEREAMVPETAVDEFWRGFVRTSQFPHRTVSSQDTLVPQVNELPHDRVDVIGDVHGLLDDLQALLQRAGWDLSSGVPRHPQNRVLLFLGDLVDRGPQSIETLRFVKRAVEAGVAFCLQGNHEAKLLSFWRQANKDGLDHWSSWANAETGAKLLALPKEEAEGLVKFMTAMPAYITYEKAKIAFVHADVEYFDPLRQPASDHIKGQSGWTELDCDAGYQRNMAAGLNQYLLVRGHIPQVSEQPRVFSLERHAFQKGELVMLRLDGFLDRVPSTGSVAAFHQSLVTQTCQFDFQAYSRKFDLIKGMERLVTDKLATRTMSPDGLLRLYKYSKRVFYEALWGESPWLLHARGLVMDLGGNIVSHTFDKCFNYGELGTGKDLADETEVIGVEKLNGFLGVISKHPFRKNELLVTTSGSFESDFVEYIRHFLDPKTKGRLLRFTSNRDLTLMFEVIHPDDPHIIEYSPDRHGLYLIGARGKQRTDQALPEHELDVIAEELGLRRPAWNRYAWGHVKQMNQDMRIEGYMIRSADEAQHHLLKLKTPFYLVTKFLGRLSAGKIKHMYANPQDFKKTLDEEFYPLVDMLVGTIPREEFLSLSDEDRVARVRPLVAELLL